MILLITSDMLDWKFHKGSDYACFYSLSHHCWLIQFLGDARRLVNIYWINEPKYSAVGKWFNKRWWMAHDGIYAAIKTVFMKGFNYI